jgi:hypothetical protein
MTWTRATTLIILGLIAPGCGGSNPAAPSPPVHETFTGDFTSPDTGGNGIGFPLSLTRGGSLTVSVSWVVLAPGTGTYGASAPGLSTYLAGNLVGNIVPDDVGDNIAQAEGLPIGGPSATPPVGFAVQVAPGEYTIVVFNSYLCGGCVTRVTVDVSHP